MFKKILKIVLHIFGVLLFVFATAYALLAAYGYQIDLLHQNITKTSIIDVATKLKEITIELDDTVVAEKAPYQINKVKPGIHKISIKKEGFNTWSKNLIVTEDVVTILNNILLIPLDLEPYTYLIEHDIIYNEILINSEYIIFVSNVANEILIYQIDNKKLIKKDTINLILKNRVLYFIDNHRLGIKDKENLFIIDLRDKETLNIVIPDEFDNFTVAYTPELTGYYLNTDTIYKVNINEDGSFNEISALIYATSCDERLKIISSYDHSYLQCNKSLYDLYDEESILIEDSLKITPKLAQNGINLLYLNEEGELVSYNLYLREKDLLGRFYGVINDIYWHSDSDHIILERTDKIEICDLDFLNCNKLLDIRKDSRLFINEKTSEFIYELNNSFEVIDLSEVI